ncbi:MAG TPA: DNA-binding response regulator [Blastocatellia bacterium]|nr:DNA-binding response regulator [Blastocatellia bacterium]
MKKTTDRNHIRILLVEAQEIFRLGIAAALEAEDDLEIAAQAGTSLEGFRLFESELPDVVITALRLPDSCAIDDLPRYFSIKKGARVIVLAERAGDAEISKALRLGALGYICKDAAPAELIGAIRKAAAGKRYVSRGIAEILTENIWREELTPAETRVLDMLVGGMSNKEICFALDVSENTVKTHISSIFGKLGVADRTSAATLAIKRGLVKIDL